MPDRVEVAIERALLARAVAFATYQSLTISLPNVKFTPPVVSLTAMWLRATFMPNDSFTLSVAPGPNQYQGFFQLDVYYGQGGGEIAPARIAAEAAVYFKFGTTVTQDGFTALIYDVPKVRQSLQDDTWIWIPVRIPYRSFADNPV